MFAYSDPTGGDFLGDQTVTDFFRSELDRTYDDFAKRQASAFTWLEAMSQLQNGAQPTEKKIDWRAFPLTAQATDGQIDAQRETFQDEYVEWLAEKTNNQLKRVTFVTEFPEYLEAFAAAGVAQLKAAIKAAIPSANPTDAELFGNVPSPENLSPTARRNAFRSRLRTNPWNNGQKGILCLIQRFNTLGALFNLLGACGVRRPEGSTDDTCSLVGGACGPGRASDPRVCSEAQKAARGNIGLTLADPAGIQILKLDGTWKINGQVIDINDPAQNQGAWTLSRNGRRGVLNVVPGLTLGDDSLLTGAQVSRLVMVAAAVLTAPEADLPIWAQTGNEGLGGRNAQIP
jgi:hypothetical protein